MAVYEVHPDATTLHGYFSAGLAPILDVEPGDTVRVRTLDAGWGLEGRRADETPRRRFTTSDPERDRGHALCGPVAVRGAFPGLTLEIQINRLVPGSYGYNAGGGADIACNDAVGVGNLDEYFLRWEIDPVAMVARDQFGHTVATRPFMGVMGLPPGSDRDYSTVTPYWTGGNLDCRELVAGTTLFLPIAVDGGLFSVGDGHAAQGDGEVSATAIECPMELVDLTFYVRDDLPIKLPRARTHEGWLTFGLHEDLNIARDQALREMLDLIQELHDVERRVALALASVVVDLRVTQVVNLVQGVHAVLPHGAIA